MNHITLPQGSSSIQGEITDVESTQSWSNGPVKMDEITSIQECLTHYSGTLRFVYPHMLFIAAGCVEVTLIKSISMSI